ncbi:MAG: glyoxalase superfamily protein [Vicinamibacterales bacterium]
MCVDLRNKRIDAFHRELIDKRYKFARPGIQDQPWGTRAVSVKDARISTATGKRGRSAEFERGAARLSSGWNDR